jgi:HSP20 family protein
MKIIKWDPFKDMMMVDEFFESMTKNGAKEIPSTWSPAVDVYETEKEIVLTAEIPGVRQEDINLTIYDNVLTLRGERSLERDVKQESYHRVERNYGYFCRRFSMPCEVESSNIRASFKDGVLKVIVPKIAQTRKVQVKVKG